jgi:hypothetical protein
VVDDVSVYLLWEWENAKEEERTKMRRNHYVEVLRPYYEKKRSEGVDWESLDLTDGTGRMVRLDKFDDIDDFDKIWNDEEWQKACARYSYFVDNIRVRILRPSILIKPE